MQGQDWNPTGWSKGGQSDNVNNITNKTINNKTKSKPTKKEQKLLDEDYVPETPPSNMKTLIMQARIAKGLKKRDELAHKMNVNVKLITEWETGKSAPTGPLKAKLQKILGIKL
tara:strand:- start:335 stop:676 length:342 start_codon:yes stop_codon:yes gene_type:complete